MASSPHNSPGIRVQLVGGPTLIVEIGGLRILTDPTFSEPGPQASGGGQLTKLAGPALGVDHLGPIDAVLLSHDQHGDNLDDAGRQFLPKVPAVISTEAASLRLGDNVRGLAPWRRTTLARPDGTDLLVTAIPAVHGPEGMEASSGPVIGFVLRGEGVPTVYISGDNASLRVVEEVAHNLGPIDYAVLFGGAARADRLDAFLTFTSDQLPIATRLLECTRAVAVHCEGWAHLTQGQDSVRDAFDAAGMSDRLVLLAPGAAATL